MGQLTFNSDSQKAGQPQGNPLLKRWFSVSAFNSRVLTFMNGVGWKFCTMPQSCDWDILAFNSNLFSYWQDFVHMAYIHRIQKLTCMHDVSNLRFYSTRFNHNHSFKRPLLWWNHQREQNSIKEHAKQISPSIWKWNQNENIRFCEIYRSRIIWMCLVLAVFLCQ